MKLTACFDTGTLTVETVAGKEAPSFSQGEPVTYTGPLTAETLLEAHDFLEERAKEQIESLGDKMEADYTANNDEDSDAVKD